MEQPKVILLFSGKRKSGKDYICEKLNDRLGDKCTVIRISGPLKGLYAERHNLNFCELLSNGPYKEKYRLDMIQWSDTVRNEDPGCFCKAACDSAPKNEVWIVSDIRRKTDIDWFRNHFGEKIKTVRVFANVDVRKSRGWVFTKGVDDVSSECDLDDVKQWDLLVVNNNQEDSEEAISTLLKYIHENVA